MGDILKELELELSYSNFPRRSSSLPIDLGAPELNKFCNVTVGVVKKTNDDLTKLIKEGNTLGRNSINQLRKDTAEGFTKTEELFTETNALIEQLRKDTEAGFDQLRKDTATLIRELQKIITISNDINKAKFAVLEKDHRIMKKDIKKILKNVSK